AMISFPTPLRSITNCAHSSHRVIPPPRLVPPCRMCFPRILHERVLTRELGSHGTHLRMERLRSMLERAYFMIRSRSATTMRLTFFRRRIRQRCRFALSENLFRAAIPFPFRGQLYRFQRLGRRWSTTRIQRPSWCNTISAFSAYSERAQCSTFPTLDRVDTIYSSKTTPIPDSDACQRPAKFPECAARESKPRRHCFQPS